MLDQPNLRPTNKGLTWNSAGPSRQASYSFLFDANDYIYAVTSAGGVYLSTNDGTTWRVKGSGIDDPVTVSIAASPDGYLYSGSFSGGVFRSVNPITDVPEIQRAAAGGLTLQPIHPNPVKGATQIQ